MMTKQEVFDKVVAHLRAQNRKALGGEDECVYRAPDGAKCAAGCLILDEHYSPALEGKGVDQPSVQDALRASGVPQEADWFVLELQRIHDYFQVSDWERRFEILAKEHGLTYAAPAAP